jgi:hypothetical protein
LAREEERKPTGKFVIEGNIQLKGLPSFNNTQISIRRVSENISKEIGLVSSDSSQYRIEVDDLNGFLVAELSEKTAGVIGAGQTRLSMTGSKGTHLRGPLITIEDSSGSVSVVDSNQKANDPSASVAAFASSNEKKTHRFQAQLYVPSADLELKTDALGFARLDRIQKHSWMLVRSEGEGLYPSMYLAQNKGELGLPGFRDSMVKALLSIYREAAYSSDRPEIDSVVWGRVVQDGSPVSGARVEVETDQNAKVVYFNQMLLPDLSLETTTDSGYFAIIYLEAGWHTLISRIGDQFHSHGNVVVDENTISPVVLNQKLSKEKVELKVFDAFTGQALSAQVQAQNLPDSLDVDGLTEVWIADLVRLSLVQVLPDQSDYLPIKSIHADSSDFWHIPMIRKDWFESLKSNRKISDSANTAAIVGFVEVSNFEVFLPHDQNYPRENIVYFDAQGLPTGSGVAGGGFILFNVPEGVQSVSVLTEGDQIASKILPIDKDTTSVLKFEN